MKLHLSKIVLFTFFTFIYCLQLNAQSEYKLNYKYKEGKTYTYSNLTDVNAVVTAMGQEMKSGTFIKTDVKLKVDNVAKNNDMVLVSSIDSGSVKVHTPMQDTTISLSMLAGKRVKLILSEIGKIKSREVLDSIHTTMTLGGIDNREAIHFLKFPEKKVKVGETWNSQDIDTVSAMGGAIVNNSNAVFTLAGKEKKNGYNCLKITFTGDLKNEGNAFMSGQKLFIEGTGKISGSLFFDPDKGIIIQSETNTDMEMTLATTGEQNMIIPMTQSVKNTVSIVE